ncbi:hypothetical protein WHR41_06913 [Cladosporium halotolerans]|uniref:Nucleotide exchange factor Fes1 domain-containing protein n=1 Tax=Cladosporium halotolerans TaxID=1052096 RepID=A0AB34KHV0_9PEZI
MNDPGLNQLLQWSIQNTDASRTDPTTTQTDAIRDPNKGLNPELLAQLMGAPSEAELMKQAMSAIVAPLDQVDLENKLVAFDNFEQLIEGIDNANNMQPLGLWIPLVEQLDNENAEMRAWAAACLSTAVQNNVACQERCLAINAIPKLVKIVLDDEALATRKKAASALSSEVRNYQPGADELVKHVPEDLWSKGKVDAGNMDAVDELIQVIRAKANRA